MTPAAMKAWRARSRPLLQKAPIARPATPQQGRRALSDAEYAIQRQRRYLAAGGRCERCGIRLGARWESHHVIRRSHHLDHGERNLRVLCPEDHAWVHANIAVARAEGWIMTAWPQL